MLAFATIASILALMASVVSAANHTIIVGGAAGLVFTPSNITAQINDFVTFVFQTKNHTVTQSGFASPCTLLANATTQTVGFDSGYVPVAANATEFPAWTIQVTVSTPLWFYCKQGNHCTSGMVGAINAATSGNKTFTAFRALAMSPASTPSAAASIAATATGAGAAGAGSQTLSGAAASSAIIAATAASNNAGVQSINPNSAYTTKSLNSAIVAIIGVAAFALTAL